MTAGANGAWPPQRGDRMLVPYMLVTGEVVYTEVTVLGGLTEHEGYEGMPREDGCWADVWSDWLRDYRACGMEPEDSFGLCARHAVELRNAKQEVDG